jgi:hypothetical protein
MATERLRGNVPDWLSAGQAGFDFGRGVRQDVALSDDAKAPDPDIGLISVANPNDNGPQPEDPDNPGLESARQGPTTRAPNVSDIQAARLQRRAQIMRQYGDDAGADKLLQSNAQLGLTNAQTGEVTQRTANENIQGQQAAIGLEEKRRENDAAISQKQIRDRVTGQLADLTDEDGNPRAPTADESLANQKELATQLYMAGHTDAADKQVAALKKSVADQIAADSTLRKAAANQIYTQVESGDFSGVAGFVKRFGYGLGAANIQARSQAPC